ncbi:MAG: MBL fold metallo-hydrolase [Lachnospira sp.]
MKITNQVHLIRKEFQVTPSIKRYINVYLIVGKYCYLIDSGVSGTLDLIENYLKSMDRDLTDIKGIFLTHSHPDHIGGASETKNRTNCKIYAPVEELSWIEDIQKQFSERPIPNFFNLLPQSVAVNEPLKDKDVIEPEDGIKICGISTKGHSHGSMSYVLNDEVIFTGDAIPVANDLPIFTDYEQTLQSLDILENISGIQYYCPAWDNVYTNDEFSLVIKDSKEMLIRLYNAVSQIENEYSKCSDAEKTKKICERAGMSEFSMNPLIAKSIEACRSVEIRRKSKHFPSNINGE